MGIEVYSPQLQSKVVALADQAFGEGYFVKPSEIARTPDTCLHVWTTSDDRVVGFAYGRLLPQGGLDAFLEGRVADIPADLRSADDEGALGVIQMVAVAPGNRGKGLGTKLIRSVHDAIVGRGGDKLIVTFKRGPAEGQVDRIMETLGFKPWVKLETYFKDRCERGEFHCDHRTNGCSCEAIFYRKEVY